MMVIFNAIIVFGSAQPNVEDESCLKRLKEVPVAYTFHVCLFASFFFN